MRQRVWKSKDIPLESVLSVYHVEVWDPSIVRFGIKCLHSIFFWVILSNSLFLFYFLLCLDMYVWYACSHVWELVFRLKVIWGRKLMSGIYVNWSSSHLLSYGLSWNLKLNPKSFLWTRLPEDILEQPLSAGHGGVTLPQTFKLVLEIEALVLTFPCNARYPLSCLSSS